MLKAAPATQKHAPLAYFLVTRQRLVIEIKKVIVQRHYPFHEFHVSQQAAHVLCKELIARYRANAARV